MKNKSEEIVLEDLTCGYKRIAKKLIIPSTEEAEEIIYIRSFYKNLDGEWIEKNDSPTSLEFSDIIKIYEAWGKKKEVTENDVWILLFGLRAIEDKIVTEENITKFQTNFITNWLSKLGIEVKSEGEANENNKGMD